MKKNYGIESIKENCKELETLNANDVDINTLGVQLKSLSNSLTKCNNALQRILTTLAEATGEIDRTNKEVSERWNV